MQADFDRPRRPMPPPELSTNKPLFVSPPAAGRRITAGFSWLQRIGKSASYDVWFPEALRAALDSTLARGQKLGDEDFPAEWAAVRQFELLQEAGNYKIYDLDSTHLTRTLTDLARNMRGGGYRVTVATIGSYDTDETRDDLRILDQRLQDRLSHLIHMLYLEEQSATANASNAADLASGAWDFRNALPHVGATLGARDLFRPIKTSDEKDDDKKDSDKKSGGGKSGGSGGGGVIKLSAGDRRQKLACHFFDILSLLPARHIVHDTAIGLQLPELIGENEWIYLAQEEDTLRSFNRLLSDLFRPFDRISMSALDGRTDAAPEIKSTVQHMRGYGDRLSAESDSFYRQLARAGL